MNTLSVHDNHLGVFSSYTNREIDLKNPNASMIDERDIAYSLSKICRFGGHTVEHYSVAEHSILVAALAPEELKLEALLHDAAEAYVGDVITPLKNILGEAFTKVEDKFLAAIWDRFKLSTESFHKIKQYDIQALELEYRAFKLGKATEYVKICNLHLQEAGRVFQGFEVPKVFLALLNRYATKRHNTEEFNQHFI